MTNDTKAPERIDVEFEPCEPDGRNAWVRKVGTFDLLRGDYFNEVYIRHDHALALVAAAYEDAGDVVDKRKTVLEVGTELSDRIRARTPTDAQAALEAYRKRVREEALREIAEKLGNLHDGFTYRPSDMKRHVLALIEGDDR